MYFSLTKSFNFIFFAFAILSLSGAIGCTKKKILTDSSSVASPTPTPSPIALDPNAGAASLNWLKQQGVVNGSITTTGIALSASGNIYISGYTLTALYGQTQQGMYDAFLLKYDSTGKLVWARQYGLSMEYTLAYDVAVDPAENIYLTGTTSAGLLGNSQTGTYDTFFIRFNSDGTVIDSYQAGRFMKTAKTFGLAITGVPHAAARVAFVGATNSISSLFNTSVREPGVNSFYVGQYLSLGVISWVEVYGGSGDSNFSTQGRGVAVDSDNNTYAVGDTTGGLNGNTNSGNLDLFVVKYDTDGVKQWTKQVGSIDGGTAGHAAATDTQKNVYVVGNTAASLLGNTLVGRQDCLVIKYDTSGNTLWAKQYGSAGANIDCQKATTDANNNLYVIGSTNRDFHSRTLNGTSDFFLAKISPDGTLKWVNLLGVANQGTMASGLAIDSGGNLFVGGMALGSLPGNAMIGSMDFFIGKFLSTVY